MAIQEALEEENTKDTPSFGTEDLEEIHRSGTKAGLLGLYNFPGAVYATDGSNYKGVMGELGAACIALEDAKENRIGNQ